MPSVVLVVDDEPAISQMVGRALRAARHEVLVAESAAAARELFGRNMGKIRLLVSDVMLGDGNGVVLAGELQRLEPGLRVLLMSGFMEDVHHREMAAHGYCFLAKPFAMEELHQQVCALLTQG